MTANVSCPEPARWEELLEGALPEAEQSALGSHLETCGRCQQTLEGLAAGGAAWGAAARHLGVRRQPDEPALRRVLAVLEAQAAGLLTPVTADPSEELTLDFLDPPEKPGQLGRLGHYEALEVLGRGGMGLVLKAFDPALHRVVAVKVLSPQLATSATARKRFVREARAAAAVRHEHVVDVHAVGEANGFPYLVMEYVGGTSLQQRLDREGPLPLEEVLRIGMQTAAGLAAAHAQGLVHRDVKPANILLENGVARVKITDFGLARAADDASLSQTGMVAGTPEYMAPEQARGEPLDHRADLFSLGSVLYAMAAGRAPFRADGTLGVLRLVGEASPRPLREVNPHVPDWLAAAVERLHARHPADRYQSAAEVAELLGRHLARLQAPGVLPLTPEPSPPLRGRGRKWLLRWAAAVAVLALGGLGMTEATGVTHVVPTVVRVVQGDGSLVVEVDDPEVKVSVEGDGGLVITGAGPRELRLRPGSYRLRASKDGTTVREEVVTVLRGGRQTVRVSRETGGRAAAPAPDTRFRGHTGPVRCLAISSDGKRALSGGDDKTLRLWDLASGVELRRFDGHTDAVMAVAFDANGRRAVSGGADRAVRLWNVDTGEALGFLRGHTGTVRSVAFVPGSQYVVSGSEDGTARLWDVVNEREERSFVGHQGGVTSAAVDGDGRRLLTGGDDSTVRVWDLATGSERHRLEGHTRPVYAVAFSPDGRRAASGGDDRTVRLWDVDGGRLLHCLEGHANAVVRVAFTPDGRQVLSAGSQYQTADPALRVWDAAAGRPVCNFGGAATDRLGCAAFAPDGRTALSGGTEPTLRLWKLSR
jgi:WD40 repeat protein/serine/threonine protein kinase